MYYIFSLNVGYLIGSIPFSLLLGKIFYKKDIREAGSGNLGASNAGRVLGEKIGIATLLLDLLKCSLSVLIIFLLLRNNPDITYLSHYLYLAGIGVLIGHCYPLFASFRGGKAVASTFGFLLIMNLYLFLIGVVLFFLILKLTKTVSLSSMFSLVFVAILSFLPIFNNSLLLGVSLDLAFSITLLVMVSLVIYRHESNIVKIMNRSENKVTWL
jgi:glycerol-3-phosphate acyltransferase PlsY